MNVNERIKKVREMFFSDQNILFAKALGISRQYANNLVNDGVSVGDGMLDLILEKAPRINHVWLKMGEGEMLKSNTEISELKGKFVPLIPIEAAAGFPGEDFPGVRYEDCEQYYVPEFQTSGVEFVIRVSGSSMYPKYSNGDVLACKKISDILFFQWGKVYVIDSSQGSLVKRVFEDKDNPENLLLVSDNKENYPAFSIPKSDIRSLSIVLGVIRME